MKYIPNFDRGDRKPSKTILKFCDEILPTDFSDFQSDIKERQSGHSLSGQDMERM